jgi:hypothetical protein
VKMPSHPGGPAGGQRGEHQPLPRSQAGSAGLEHRSPSECRSVASLNDVRLQLLETSEVEMASRLARLEGWLIRLQQQLVEYQRHLRLQFKIGTWDMDDPARPAVTEFPGRHSP